MNLEFLEKFKQDDLPIIDHVHLFRVDWEDLIYDNIQYGEETLTSFIIRKASSIFDRFYYADNITRLTEMSNGQRILRESTDKQKGRGQDRRGRRHQNITEKDIESMGDFDSINMLYRVTQILRERQNSSLVIIDYFDKICSSEILTHQDREAETIVLKWQHDLDIFHTRNLVLLICRNWEHLSGDLKKNSIPVIEISQLDSKTYEGYLRYIINYIREA